MLDEFRLLNYYFVYMSITNSFPLIKKTKKHSLSVLRPMGFQYSNVKYCGNII